MSDTQSEPISDRTYEDGAPDLPLELFGTITDIPESSMREAHRIRCRLIWFWQNIFHLSEKEAEQLGTICQWCLGEMEMKFVGREQPIVVFCNRPCNISVCHLGCWIFLIQRHQQESACNPEHPGFQCFSCRTPTEPLVSYLFNSHERATGLPILDHLALCPWCRVLEQPLDHLLKCQELPIHFAGLSAGEIGDLLNLIPRLLNSFNPIAERRLDIYESNRRSSKFQYNIRVNGAAKQLVMKLCPNMMSYDADHAKRIFKSLFHVWSTVETYITPGAHPVRREEFQQLHSNILYARQFGLAFPHQWCQGHGKCLSLLTKEAFAIFRSASKVVTILTDDDWGIPMCINNRLNGNKTHQHLPEPGHADGDGPPIGHIKTREPTSQTLLALSVLSRRVRNTLRRPVGSEEVGRQLMLNFPGMSRQLLPALEAFRRAVSQYHAE